MWSPAKHRAITDASKRNALNIKNNALCWVNRLLCIPKVMYAFDVNVIVSPYPFCRARIAVIPSSTYGGGIVKIRLVIIWCLWSVQVLLFWWGKWKNTRQNWLSSFEQAVVKERHWAFIGERREKKNLEKCLFLSALFLTPNEVEKKMTLPMPRLQNWVSVHNLRSPGISYQLKECLSLHHNRSPIYWHFGVFVSLQSLGFFMWVCCLANLMVGCRILQNFDSASGKEEWRSRRVNFWNPPFLGFEQSVLLWNLLKSHLLLSFWPPKLFLCKCWHPAEMKSLTWENTTSLSETARSQQYTSNTSLRFSFFVLF